MTGDKGGACLKLTVINTSVDQQREQICGLLIKKYDVNGSGQLGRDAFRQLLMKGTGKRCLSQKQCDDLFLKLDVDRSGTIDIDEFVAYVTKAEPPQSSSPSVLTPLEEALQLEIAVLRSENAVLKSQLQEVQDSFDRLKATVDSSGSVALAETELPDALKNFIPIMKTDAIKPHVASISEAELGVVGADTKAFMQSFRKLIAPVQELLDAEIETLVATDDIVRTCDTVIEEGNRNFEMIYKVLLGKTSIAAL
jgi:Ca2+-binding EF-hand superfamily protein